MSLQTSRYRQFIDAAAELCSLPWWRGEYSPGTWLEALVMTESSGEPKATRYEPHQDRAGRPDASSDADIPGKDDGHAEDDKSYGLAQIMGYNVRRLVGALPGVSLNFSFLFDPILGLGFGLQILRQELSATNGNVDRALARYNGGPTGDRLEANGKLRRQEYVDKVLRWAERVRADRGGAA